MAINVKEKPQASAVDAVFKLRFEVLWVPPYDFRRSEPAFCEFEHRVSRVASLLCAVGLGESAPESRLALREAVMNLQDSIYALRETGIFSAEVYEQAEMCFRELAAEVGIGQ